jgi:WD40 repeat protein
MLVDRLGIAQWRIAIVLIAVPVAMGLVASTFAMDNALQLTSPDARVNGLVFVKDSRTIAGVTGRYVGLLQEPRGGDLFFWAIASAKKTVIANAHKDGISSVALSPDGTTLATSGYDGFIKLWAASNGEMLGEIDGKVGPLNCVAFSSDGKCLAAGGWQGNKSDQLSEFGIWRIADRHSIATIKAHTRAVTAVQFLPSSNTDLITGGSDGAVKLWGPMFRERQLSPPSEMAIFSIAASPDRKKVVLGAGDLLAKAGIVSLWETGSWKLASKVSVPGAVLTVAISPNGEMIAVAGTESAIQIMDAAKLNTIAKFKSGGTPIRSVAFSHSGLELVSGNTDGLVLIHQLKSLRE